jgi:hypothetical protein
MMGKYRIIRSSRNLEYRVQYCILWFLWVDCSSHTFNSQTQAEDYVTKLQRLDTPEQWEVVRIYR